MRLVPLKRTFADSCTSFTGCIPYFMIIQQCQSIDKIQSVTTTRKNHPLDQIVSWSAEGREATPCMPTLQRQYPQELSSSRDGRQFGHNRHWPRIRELCPFYGGAGPHLTQCCLRRGLPPYQVASWSIQPFGHNRHGLKIGVCALFWGAGELGPYLTQCARGQGLPPCQVSSWSVQPFGHNTPMSQTDRTGQTTVWQHRANHFTNGRPKIYAKFSEVMISPTISWWNDYLEKFCINFAMHKQVLKQLIQNRSYRTQMPWVIKDIRQNANVTTAKSTNNGVQKPQFWRDHDPHHITQCNMTKTKPYVKCHPDM